MPGPRTIDDMARNDANIREVADTTREVSSRMRDVEINVRGVEVEMRGMGRTLENIETQVLDSDKRIRTIEGQVAKFTVYAAIAGAVLSILITQVVRYVTDIATKPKISEQYLEEGRRRVDEMKHDNELWKERGK